LMNSALACECEANGWLGSKTEKLDALTVITRTYANERDRKRVTL
jgi:hypothetical protein